MVKHSRRKIKTRRTYKKFKGGTQYSDEQKQQLSEAGFTQEFIKMAEKYIGFSIMWRNFKESGLPADKYMAQTYAELKEYESIKGGYKRRKTRKTRKMKGGTCYGNGVGANNYDSNFSIYNTRELQLFPYKPTN